ncbi:MAG: DUF2452 domain-containing protein [Cyclobacteriaceae bacterium]|nr:DUF2452 domain-containing protein [Cyclobacteriaceae bacterium]MCK5705472.1 DUF2452 domain-containing protein [Cyclobacteriaceae bacterium]
MSKGKKIDPNKIDLEDLKDKSSDNPGLISFPHSIGSAVIKPEDKGKIKGRAMAAMKEQTQHQLHQLYEQMRTLARQANGIKNRVKVSERIYQAQMNYEPRIGQIYHLYEKENDNDLLSMISPDEWGKDMPFKSFIASVRLLSDHTWEVLDSGKL